MTTTQRSVSPIGSVKSGLRITGLTGYGLRIMRPMVVVGSMCLMMPLFRSMPDEYVRQ